MPYELRPATDDDYERVRLIKQDGLRPYVTAHWGWDPADQDRRFREAWAPERLSLLIVGEEVVGFLELAESSEELELRGIYVDAARRGRGLGTEVIRDVLRRAASGGRRVSVQVIRGNPAEALYRRLGFEVVSETSSHVQLEQAP